MDTRLDYPSLVKEILLEHAKIKPSYGEIEPHVVFDDKRREYVLFDIGWNGARYVYGSVAHVQVTEDKIWLHYDGTEEGIATDLLASGIPKSDIVLGFRPPKLRPYTGFAVE
jgi:hypothetical protein